MASPLFESFYDLGLKKGSLCHESLVGPFSESDNTLYEWGKVWVWLKVVRNPGLTGL